MLSDGHHGNGRAVLMLPGALGVGLGQVPPPHSPRTRTGNRQNPGPRDAATDGPHHPFSAENPPLKILFGLRQVSIATGVPISQRVTMATSQGSLSTAKKSPRTLSVKQGRPGLRHAPRGPRGAPSHAACAQPCRVLLLRTLLHLHQGHQVPPWTTSSY